MPVLVHNYNQKDVKALQTGPEGTIVEVQSYRKANKLLKEAFPDYQKVAGIGIQDAKGPRRKSKLKAYNRGGAYHKDYMMSIDKKTGKLLVKGHGLKNPHARYPHINIMRRDKTEVLINIVGEKLEF